MTTETTQPNAYTTQDYSGPKARWCPGCGGHSILSIVKKVLVTEQLKPEQTVFVSGIGCSSRFPHYLKTYGFHSLHGRPLPVACGVKSRRPDLDVWVATGDGDCCAIGAGHWVHAIRYNMNMVVMLFDNSIYGLTKMQTSPTTPKHSFSNTHPTGALLSPLNPLMVTLSITNASFVAQTLDWQPQHLYDTLLAAHRHPGLSFVRIIQRCTHFKTNELDSFHEDADTIQLLEHETLGLVPDEKMKAKYPHLINHDPSNLAKAFALASDSRYTPAGILYRNLGAERYDDLTAQGLGKSPREKIAATEKIFSSYLI